MAYVIPTTFTAIDLMTGPVMRMQKAMTGLTTIAGVRGAALSASLNEISNKAMNVATNAAMIGAAVAVPLGLATKAAIDFEAQMANVSTLVDTAKESMGAMGDEVLRVAKEIPKPISDLTESLYQIRSAGIAGAQAMHVLEVSGRLSVAGLSSVTDATKAVTSAMVGFKQQNLTTDQIANSFFLTVKEGKTKMDALNESFGAVADIVGESGLKMQDFMAATAALTNTGLTASESMMSLRQFIISLKKPSAEMTDVLENLGFKGADAGQQMINKYGDLGDIMMALKNEAHQVQDNINKALGRAQALVGFTALTGNQHSKYLENFKEQMQGVDNVMGAFMKQNKTAAAQMQIFDNNMRSLAISIGNILIPSLNKTMAFLNPVIDGFAWITKSFPDVTAVIVGGAGAFAVFTLSLAGVSFAIATITKATWLWNGAMAAFDFTMGVASVQMGTWNAVMLATPARMAGATLAMKGFSAATKSAFVELALAYGIYKIIMNEMDRQKQNKNLNPLGFDYDDAAGPGSKKNKGIRDKYGISEMQFNYDKAYYNYQKNQDLKPGEMYNVFGGKVARPFHFDWSNTIYGKAKQMSPEDSTNFKMYQQIQKREDSDSSFNKTEQNQDFNYQNRYKPDTTSPTVTVNNPIYISVDKDGKVTAENKPKKNGVYTLQTHTANA